MIIDGKKIAAEILREVKIKVAALPFQPVFCDVLVGDDPVSALFVRIKAKTAEAVGIKFHHAQYPADISSGELVAQIKIIGQLKDLCGLIVQLPLPADLPRVEILDAIPSELDVDVVGGESSRKFYAGQQILLPPTAAAILTILETLPEGWRRQKILVLGQGELVGRPVAHLLRQQGLDVTTADRSTPDLPGHLRQADIIISAAGQGRMITGDLVKPGAIVIDAGTSELGGGIVGDADFDSLSARVSFITPVPGGVGPVTVAKLLENVLLVAEQKHKI
ncbi:MAG: bifunctional 5,10-methylenetetrahydrofolate dehydrogenase/5,10-methenyltetrahydrofolate cyclohydrolase [Patescibacteria group bacterium]|nr:bifunctional 5,10-methylenetetrahydrofolate dehydrogenase/5,10-methenyltetrahydrofolate cyclohydrolase [Patescibacteria group bacterium]